MSVCLSPWGEFYWRRVETSSKRGSPIKELTTTNKKGFGKVPELTLNSCWLLLLGHPEGSPLHESNPKKNSVLLLLVVVVPVIKA